MTDPRDATRRKLVIAASGAGAGLLLTAGNPTLCSPPKEATAKARKKRWARSRI
jgi:hypothetical protein